MKKNRFNVLITVFVTLFIIAGFSALFTSCLDSLNGEEKNSFVALEITSGPNKTSYTKGETLDLTGLTVQTVDANGYRSICNDYTSTPAAGEVLNTTGWQEVVVEKVIKMNRGIKRYKDTFEIQVTN